MIDFAAAVDAVILRHGRRGMDRLAPYVAGACGAAAATVAGSRRGTVGIITGFWVDGAAETDGPLGAVCLARGLARLDFAPVVVADPPCSDLVAALAPTWVVAVDADPVASWDAFCRCHDPCLLIAVERCGRSASGDYANMRGVSVAAHTAPLDRWFELAAGRLPTIGIGDGGNEVGMGRLATVVERELAVAPCVVATDHLIVATVSNWGAYGLLAVLQAAGHGPLLPTAEEVADLLHDLVARGAVDGVTGRREATVDGFPLPTELEVVAALAELVR